MAQRGAEYPGMPVLDGAQRSLQGLYPFFMASSRRVPRFAAFSDARPSSTVQREGCAAPGRQVSVLVAFYGQQPSLTLPSDGIGLAVLSSQSIQKDTIFMLS